MVSWLSVEVYRALWWPWRARHAGMIVASGVSGSMNRRDAGHAATSTLALAGDCSSALSLTPFSSKHTKHQRNLTKCGTAIYDMSTQLLVCIHQMAAWDWWLGCKFSVACFHWGSTRKSPVSLGVKNPISTVLSMTQCI